MARDWEKLSRLLPLKVVSQQDKLRWLEAFLESYGAVEGLNPYVKEARVVEALGGLGAKLTRLREEGARELERRERRADEVATRLCELTPEEAGCARRAAERARREAAERARREAAERARREAAERAERERQEAESIQWVRIPAGSFQMGSQDGDSDEKPIHTVTLRAFLMSKTEVTVGQYRKCVEAGVCSEPSSWSSNPGSKENHPVTGVDWGQARTFAKWVGADLPTEAEWEYAARGGQSFTYAGSNSPDDVAWYSSNSGGGTKPVGTKRANGYGLQDMSGNVWEWVLDEYKNDYSNAPSDGHQAVGSIPICRTRCDNGDARRVNRGGGWHSVASPLRVAYRRSYPPDYRFGNLGLRLRRTLP
ncbi:MAG: formylglycine-generating enzyme family protein [Deltaproteobacteria bacterium]|nr:formylglycine-generating enzyme family protein [Deltaproteobacteria bacterium]